MTEWRHENFDTAPALSEARHTVMPATLAYLNELNDEQLNANPERLPEDWTGPPRSPAFILHHILTHAFHHKGQIVAMFRILGYPAPDTDLQRVEP